MCSICFVFNTGRFLQLRWQYDLENRLNGVLCTRSFFFLLKIRTDNVDRLILMRFLVHVFVNGV